MYINKFFSPNKYMPKQKEGITKKNVQDFLCHLVYKKVLEQQLKHGEVTVDYPRELP